MNDKADDAMKDGSNPGPEQQEGRKPSVPPGVQGVFGRILRSAYSEMVKEPLPDKFRELLDRLGKAEK